MTATTPLLPLRREIAVLRRRIQTARDLGLPTADLVGRLGVVRTNLEIEEQRMREAAAGYAPIAAS